VYLKTLGRQAYLRSQTAVQVLAVFHCIGRRGTQNSTCNIARSKQQYENPATSRSDYAYLPYTQNHNATSIICCTQTEEQRLSTSRQHNGRSVELVSRTSCVRVKKGKGSPYSITERRVPELIPVLGSQPAGDVSHRPGGRLLLLSARPAVTLATLKRAATSFTAW